MTAALHYKPRPSLTPKKQSLTDKAYSAIKAVINGGEIPLDAFINMPEIEQQLGMSRTPVREAMLRLQTEKVVEIVPKRGIRINALTTADLADYYQLITALEVEAAGNIARREPSRTEIMPLLHTLNSMEDAIGGVNHEAWAEAEENFHRSLFVLSGNARLSETGMNFRDVVQRAHFEALRHISMEAKADFLPLHNNLKDLLLFSDEATVRETFLAQCGWASELVIGTLDRLNIEKL
ncbi:MAG: GntR family transcriptional regulator [Alphaproteobacteria bacterium]|nr:MAG: GntR family transcriptional regulator [Alphaproteobacteria bacterium]